MGKKKPHNMTNLTTLSSFLLEHTTLVYLRKGGEVVVVTDRSFFELGHHAKKKKERENFHGRVIEATLGGQCDAIMKSSRETRHFCAAIRVIKLQRCCSYMIREMFADHQ